jgi:hypothetical protein
MKPETQDWIARHRDEVDRHRGRWCAVHPEDGIVMSNDNLIALQLRIQPERDGVELVFFPHPAQHEEKMAQLKTVENALWIAYQAGISPLDDRGVLTPEFVRILTERGVEVL